MDSFNSLKKSGSSAVKAKTVQWGTNAAAEFTLHNSTMDLSNLSPTTVERYFPSSFDRYEEMHPVDEEMLRMTKENSAILAALDECFDDSSSESSSGSCDEIHCFKDVDDDDEYFMPVRRSSKARKNRRSSGIFTPEPLLEPSHDGAARSSAFGLSALNKLTLSSPLNASTRNIESEQATDVAGGVPQMVIVDPREMSPGVPNASKPPLTLATTEAAGTLEFVLSCPASALTQNVRINHSVELLHFFLSFFRNRSLTIFQFLQFCLSPLSQVEDISVVPSLERVLRKMSDMRGVGFQESDGRRICSFSEDDFSWLEPFDSNEAFRELADQSFLTAQTAVSHLPQANQVSHHDPGFESWAISEWLTLETQALEAIDVHLSSGLMQEVSTLCDNTSRITKEIGTLKWIQGRCFIEDQTIHHLEKDLLMLECECERRKKECLEQELCTFVANRYSTYLSQTLSPFCFKEWDDVEMQLVFGTPIQGLDIIVVQNSENGSLDIEYDESSVLRSKEDRDRIEPSHHCATFYRAMLRACIGILPPPDPQDIMQRLQLFALQVVRLENACWDLYRLALSHSTYVLDAGEDNERVVTIIAMVSPEVSFRTIYDLSDVRTISLCRPTSSHLHVSTTGEPISQSYPIRPLVQVLKSLLDYWMTRMSDYDEASQERGNKP